jgi:hypothetical protein
MSTTLALCPSSDVVYPVIVAHDAYAVGIYMARHDSEQLTVGVMPQRERVGIVGASAEQVAKDMEASLAPGAAPDFNPTSFKDRLRLRRLLAAQAHGDNRE